MRACVRSDRQYVCGVCAHRELWVTDTALHSDMMCNMQFGSYYIGQRGARARFSVHACGSAALCGMLGVITGNNFGYVPGMIDFKSQLINWSTAMGPHLASAWRIITCSTGAERAHQEFKWVTFVPPSTVWQDSQIIDVTGPHVIA